MAFGKTSPNITKIIVPTKVVRNAVWISSPVILKNSALSRAAKPIFTIALPTTIVDISLSLFSNNLATKSAPFLF